MKSETRYDRRARFEVEALEGRRLMSAGLGPEVKFQHVEHGHVPVQPSIAAVVAADSTASGTITISGKTSPHAKVILALLDGRIFENTVWSNASGRFHHTFAVGYHPHQAPKTLPVPGKSALTAAVTSGPNENGSVTLRGKTFPMATVTLDPQADGEIEQTVKADARGRFQFTFQVGFGRTTERLTARAAAPAASMPPISTTVTVYRPFVYYPLGTSGSPQTQPQGGSHWPADSGLVSELNGLRNAKYAIEHSLLPDNSLIWTWVD
jgi:hypothetical protein